MSADKIDVLAGLNLSDSQVYILEMLNPEWDGAIDGPTANVLRSLERRGFARHTEWPRKCWSITEEGSVALARVQGRFDTPSGHDAGCVEHPPGFAQTCSCGARVQGGAA